MSKRERMIERKRDGVCQKECVGTWLSKWVRGLLQDLGYE